MDAVTLFICSEVKICIYWCKIANFHRWYISSGWKSVQKCWVFTVILLAVHFVLLFAMNLHGRTNQEVWQSGIFCVSIKVLRWRHVSFIVSMWKLRSRLGNLQVFQDIVSAIHHHLERINFFRPFNMTWMLSDFSFAQKRKRTTGSASVKN